METAQTKSKKTLQAAGCRNTAAHMHLVPAFTALQQRETQLLEILFSTKYHDDIFFFIEQSAVTILLRSVVAGFGQGAILEIVPQLLLLP